MTGKRGRAAAALALGAAAIFATFAGAGVGGAAEGKHGVRLHTLAHFNQPTFAAGPPNSKHLVFVTERPGRIKVLHGDRRAAPSST